MMTSINQVIEIALNDGMLVPSRKVIKVEIGNSLITVWYFDKVTNTNEVCYFSI